MERAVETLHRSQVDEVVVVIGYASRDVLGRLDLNRLRVVINPGFEEGLSSSLRAGVSALDRKSEAVLVCLADQPFVTSELIDRVLTRFAESGAAAVAAASGDLVSPPMLLTRALFDDMDQLREDKGAKSLAMAQPTFEKIETSRESLLDVDTEEDMLRARAILKARPRETARGGDAPSRGRPSSRK